MEKCVKATNFIFLDGQFNVSQCVQLTGKVSSRRKSADDVTPVEMIRITADDGS